LRVRKDNSEGHLKASLRLQARRMLSGPITMLETHGGMGHLWRAVFADVTSGVVFEVESRKAEALAVQRPTWSVYEADSRKALTAGAARHLVFNLIDVDPFGDPWGTIEAIFTNDRPLAERIVITVNDGMHRKVKVQGGWSARSLQPAVRHFGNHGLNARYLEMCRWNMERLVSPAGYAIREWTAYHCGLSMTMTHYAALLCRADRS
jgi:hypothetical protein